jgi:hypothetical protein
MHWDPHNNSNTTKMFASNIGRRIAAFGRKVVGQAPRVVKSIADFAGRAGRFVRDHHQPLAMALMGAQQTFAPNNRTFENIAGLGLLGSAAATAMGVGRDYGYYRGAATPAAAAAAPPATGGAG